MSAIPPITGINPAAINTFSKLNNDSLSTCCSLIKFNCFFFIIISAILLIISYKYPVNKKKGHNDPLIINLI